MLTDDTLALWLFETTVFEGQLRISHAPSPDQRWFVYSTWSPYGELWLQSYLISILLTITPFKLCYQFREYPPIPFLVHVCNVRGEEEHHSSLDMRPDLEDRFCAFSVKFSNDSSEIVAS